MIGVEMGRIDPGNRQDGFYSEASRCLFFCRSSISRRVHSAHLKMCRSLSSANVTSLGLSIKFLNTAGSGHPLRSGLG